MKKLMTIGAVLPLATASIFGFASNAEAAGFFSPGDSTAVAGFSFLFAGRNNTPLNSILFCDETLVGATLNVGSAPATTQDCAFPTNNGAVNGNTAATDFSPSPAVTFGGFNPLRNTTDARIKSVDFDNSGSNFINNWFFGSGTTGNAAGVRSFFQFDANESDFVAILDEPNDTVTFTLTGLLTRTDVSGGAPVFDNFGEIVLNGGTVAATDTEQVLYDFVFTTQGIGLDFSQAGPGGLLNIPNVGSSAPLWDFISEASSYSFDVTVAPSVPEPSSVLGLLGLGALTGAGALKRRVSKDKKSNR